MFQKNLISFSQCVSGIIKWKMTQKAKKSLVELEMPAKLMRNQTINAANISLIYKWLSMYFLSLFIIITQ